MGIFGDVLTSWPPDAGLKLRMLVSRYFGDDAAVVRDWQGLLVAAGDRRASSSLRSD